MRTTSIQKTAFLSPQKHTKKVFEQRVLQCLPWCPDVPFNQFQISHFVAGKNNCFLFSEISTYLTSFFSGGFKQTVRVFCFSDLFFPKTTQQPHGSCNVTSLSLFLCELLLFKKQPFYLHKNIPKKFLSKEYCSVYHDAQMCLLTNFKYHILLLEKIIVFYFLKFPHI